MTVKVYMIESERGWGQKIDEVKSFPTLEEAQKFANEYNEKYNPPGPAPDWYIVAKVEE